MVLAVMGCSSSSSKQDASASTDDSSRPGSSIEPSAPAEPVLPARDLASDIRLRAIGLATTVKKAADYEVDATPLATALEAHKAEISDCFQGRALSHDPGTDAGDVWLVARITPSGHVDDVRMVRSSAPPASSECARHVLETISFSPSATPVALSTWIGVHPKAKTPPLAAGTAASSNGSAAPSPSYDPEACATDRTESYLSACAASPAAQARNIKWGDPIGDSFGAGGLGLSGVGEGGGRDDGIGLGSIGPGHGAGHTDDKGFGYGPLHRGKPPRVRMGATSVSGRLPPEVIQRIVRQNFGRFRLCYENGLQTDPTLEGTVTVSFIIGTDGSVTNVGGGGLGDVGRCVVRSFGGLSFPTPEAGIVKVTYPIAFSPGETAPGAGASVSAEPAPAPPKTTIGGVELDKVMSTNIVDALGRAGVQAASVDGDPKADIPFAVFAEGAQLYSVIRVQESCDTNTKGQVSVTTASKGFRLAILSSMTRVEPRVTSALYDK